MELTKQEFLERYSQFEGNDDDGYVFPTIAIDSDEFVDLSGGLVEDLEMLENILENPDDNEEILLELNNCIMNKFFGDGDSFQGSFEEERGSGEYCWYLDFGRMSIDEDYEVQYSGISFYCG